MTSLIPTEALFSHDNLISNFLLSLNPPPILVLKYKSKYNTWYNRECHCLKSTLHSLYQHYWIQKKSSLPKEYFILKQQLSNLVKAKKYNFPGSSGNYCSRHTGQKTGKFWVLISGALWGKLTPPRSIPSQTCFSYFLNLFNEAGANFLSPIEPGTHELLEWSPISLGGITILIMQLKSKKSPAPDAIIPELLKFHPEWLAPPHGCFVYSNR